MVARRPSRRDQEQLIDQRHGAFADEVKAEWFAKQLTGDALAEELSRIKENWHVLWQDLDSVLRPADRIREILSAAGAPTEVGALGLTPSHLETAFKVAHQIRNRFTVLDFAYDLGVSDEITAPVLQSSGCLG